MDKDLVFLEVNSSTIAEQNLIKISPVGDFKGIDGRSYKLNGKAVLETFKTHGRDLMP